VSIEGQDEREWTLMGGKWRGDCYIALKEGMPVLDVGESVDVVPRSRLVESEARERELEVELAKAQGYEPWDGPQNAIHLFHRERERGAALSKELHASQAREAVLVEALKEAEHLFLKVTIVNTATDNPDSATTLRYAREYADKGEKLCRSALAGVVEAEPARCACGHPEREGWGHRSHECCPIGPAEPDGSKGVVDGDRQADQAPTRDDPAARRQRE
jgi:hypothetical protein